MDQPKYLPCTPRVIKINKMPKFTLQEHDVKLIFPQSLEQNPQISVVILLILRVYQDVVNEPYHKEIKIWLKPPIHQLHERCRGVSQTKRHYKKFIV